MTQSGRVDYDQVARAQALLLDRRRLRPEALIAAYRTVRTATPDAYTEFYIAALISHGFDLRGEAQIETWEEAVEVARRGTDRDPRMAKVLIDALTKYKHVLCDTGRRAEALVICREMVRVGRRAFADGVVPTPTFGAWQLACELAEDGEHAEAAALLDEIVRDNEQAGRQTSFWTWIARVAELEAAGRDVAAREALRELIDEDRRRADRNAAAYATVIWEQLFLAFIDRAHGREDEAERCDQETEALLTKLATDGEPKIWGIILKFWVVLAGVAGGARDRTRIEGTERVELPLFSDLNWSPRAHREKLDLSYARLQEETARIAELAERDPATHLGDLVESQREFKVRAVKYWEVKARRVTDEVRGFFDESVDLAHRLADFDEPRGRAALARALADRAGMHVAAQDFPSALLDFQRSRQVMAGEAMAKE